jgi:uncharacterized protein YaeQ
MQLVSKVIRLDLNYASETSHRYQKHSCYIAPYQMEPAEHFARRLLAYLWLFEASPQLANAEGAGKTPDLYVSDNAAHLRLWCNVDLLSEKQMQRASHQADQVLLFLDETDQKKVKSQYRQHFSNLKFQCLTHQQQLDFCDMLKGHMKLDLWQEQEQLLISDGEHCIELMLSPVSHFSH